MGVTLGGEVGKVEGLKSAGRKQNHSYDIANQLQVNFDRRQTKLD